jgi:predicted dienelactone hydrolase
MTTAATRISTLPVPTGRYAVGRTTLELVDRDRREIYSADPSDRRELVLWTWYPAEADPDAEPADYLPGAWLTIAPALGLDVAGMPTHAVTDAPLADDDASYPVLLLAPSGFSPLLMSAIGEELASHGYVVVGVNPTYESPVTVFADGRVVPMNPAAVGGALGPQTGSHEEAFRARAAVCDYKAADFASVSRYLARLHAGLEPRPGGRFTGRLDLSRLGALGHSFGGDAALEWCRTDPACRAAVNLDGALWTEVGRTGLDRPALQVLTDHSEFAVSSEQAVTNGMAPDPAWFEAEKAITFGGWRAVASHTTTAVTVQIAGSKHMSFMDVPFLTTTEQSPVKPMLAATTIDPERMWRITNDFLLSFFAKHLDGVPAALLTGPSAAYPEVHFGAPDL